MWLEQAPSISSTLMKLLLRIWNYAFSVLCLLNTICQKIEQLASFNIQFFVLLGHLSKFEWESSSPTKYYSLLIRSLCVVWSSNPSGRGGNWIQVSHTLTGYINHEAVILNKGISSSVAVVLWKERFRNPTPEAGIGIPRVAPKHPPSISILMRDHI